MLVKQVKRNEVVNLFREWFKIVGFNNHYFYLYKGAVYRKIGEKIKCISRFNTYAPASNPMWNLEPSFKFFIPRKGDIILFWEETIEGNRLIEKVRVV